MAEEMDTDCRACGEPMAYCEAFLKPYQVTAMDSDEAHTIDGSDTESIDSEMSEPPPPVLRYEESVPIPPPLVRRAAIEQPRLSVREQEIQYIENHGLVAFCHGAVFTAILQDADYLRAQLTYLRR